MTSIRFVHATEADTDASVDGSRNEEDETESNAKQRLLLKCDLLQRDIVVVHSRGDGIAWRVWPGATYLLEYIANERPDCLFRKGNPRCSRTTVLELGSGVGTVGLFCAGMGMRTILTDTEEAVRALERSVAENEDTAIVADADTCHSFSQRKRVVVMRLDWNSKKDAELVLQKMAEGPFGLKRVIIVLSDCTYWDSLFVPLASTIERLLLGIKDSGGQGIVLCAHERRQWKIEKRFFTKRLRQHHLDANVVAERLRDGSETNATHALTGWNQRVYKISLST